MKRIIPCVVFGLALAACGSATTTSTADDSIPGAPDVSVEQDPAVDDTLPADAGDGAASSDDTPDATEAPAADDSGADADASGEPAASATDPAVESDAAPAPEPEPAPEPAADDAPEPAADEEPEPVEEPEPEVEPAPEPEPEAVPEDDGPPACADNPYYSEKDENCSRANYQNPPNDGRLLNQLEELYGSSSKAKAVNKCLQQGGLPYYNADAPGGSKTSCTTNGAANYQPLGLSDQKGTLLPFPDYDPTVGSADTPIECAWGATQQIIQKAKNLTSGKPNIDANVVSKFNPEYSNCR